MIDYGYNQSELPWGAATGGQITETVQRQVLQGIKDVGGSRIRMSTQLGTWDDLDLSVKLSVEYGLKPLLVIINNPQFGYNGSVDSFAAMCKAVALRYGPNAPDPALRNTVSEYEIGNECNNFLNWPSSTDPGVYTGYLKAAYTSIKSVHTSSTVITGGTIPAPTTFWNLSMNPLDWIQGIYAAGGKEFCDAIGMHLYVDEPQTPTPETRQWKYITDVRDLMVAQGDSAKKILVTEVGVGYPAPGVTSLVQARDWLKILVEAIISYDYCGPFYIYNWKNYSGGDGVGASYGMVDINLVPREPMYSYAATIAGTPSDPGDIIPPDPPTGVDYSDVTSTTARILWEPPPPADGVTNSRIYTESGVQLADTINTFHTLTNLPSGTPQQFYVTHIDQAGNESDPSDTVSLTTDAPTGLQASFAYDFTGTGSTLPSVFTQLGLGFSVSGGVALPNSASSDGEFWTIALYNLDQQSPDHSSRISQATASAYPDRASLIVAQAKADGTEWIAAGIYDDGQADGCRLYTCIGGAVRLRKATNAPPLLPGEYLDIVPAGNVYTVVRIHTSGAATEVLSWTDINGVFTGAANRRPGIGWHHKRVGGVNYPPPGIASWRSVDVGPIQPAPGVSDAWMLAIADESDWGELIATGLWESSV